MLPYPDACPSRGQVRHLDMSIIDAPAIHIDAAGLDQCPPLIYMND